MAEEGAENDICIHSGEVTWAHRVDNRAVYDWCVVPETAFDVLFVPGIAVILACLLQNRLQTTLVLIIGGIIQGIMFPVNLGRFGNSIAIWLGIQPYELFFYIFLPPLLFDAAVRIDFYLFKQVAVQVMTLAFLVVIGSVGLMMPIMLFVFNLQGSGWSWQYVGLFVSMLASTDAVAIISTMKTNGGPKKLRTLLEGESLLNDASGITLFTIFLQKVEELIQEEHMHDTFWSVFGNIIGRTCWLAFGGLLMGLAFGIATLYILRYMRNKGAGVDQQVGLTFAMAYMSYYIAAAPAGVSGVISVAVLGLFGAATSRWDMPAEEGTEAFEKFWDALSFVTNEIVFFFSGLACVNFAVRSSQNLDQEGRSAVLASTLWRFPLVYLVMFAVRFVLIVLFAPLFKLLRAGLSWMDIIFATVAGLRGSVSLIMAQGLITDHDARTQEADYSLPEEIKAEIVLWTAGFVLMTLIINASILPWLLRVTGLTKVPPGKIKQRRRAVRALQNHTANTIVALKEDDDEMLRGVDWVAVERFADTPEDYEHFRDPTKPPPVRFHWWWPLSWGTHRGRPFDAFLTKRSEMKIRRKRGQPDLQDATVSHQSVKLFGRKGSGTRAPTSVDDLESGVSGLGADSSQAPEYSSSSSGSDNDDNEFSENNELPFLTRTSVMTRASRPSMTDVVVPQQLDGIDLAKEPGLAKESFSFGPQERKSAMHKPSWLRTTSMRWLGNKGAALDRDFKAGPEPLDATAPQPEEATSPPGHLSHPSMTTLTSPFETALTRAGPDIPEEAPSGAGSMELATVSTSSPMESPFAATKQEDAAQQSLQSGVTGAATGRALSLPAGHAPSSPPQDMGREVKGSMAAVVHGCPSAQATHVVRVRGGAVLPMPTPDSIEDLPSPSVTPEHATLIRMAQSLARQQPSGAPQLRVRGTALASLASAPSGPTWPRSVTDGSGSGRPPLPWRSGQGSGASGMDSPEQLSLTQQTGSRGDRSLASQLRRQLSQSRAGSSGSPTTTTGEVPDKNVRPTIFSAFPELRHSSPTVPSRHAHKHRHLLEAFSGMDEPTAHGGRQNLDASSDNERTWTAGMTKGKAPAELQAQLQQFRELKRTRSAGEVKHPLSEDPATSAEELEGSGHSQPPSRIADKDSAQESALRSKGSSDSPPSDDPAAGKHGLADAVHTAKCPLTEDELAEARVRLVVGFKRYFHGKRLEGLLSSRGLRILDNACDTALEHAERPLCLWNIIDRDASGRFVVNFVAYQMFIWRRGVIKLRQRRTHGWKWAEWLRRQLAWPLVQAIRLTHWQLSKLMLLSLEVAMEYMLALLHSPQVQLLRHHDTLGVLQEEIRDDLELVWSFIVEREVEAPERFQAIQSYRATMAVLRQQRLFVHQLFDSGVVEDQERDELLLPVEEKERHLVQKGPTWKAPSFLEVLRSIPFLRHTPQRVVEVLYRHGRLRMYKSQVTIRQSSNENGIFIVGSGLVRVTYRDLSDTSHEYFLGTGGVYGLYTALTGAHLPGHVEAVAQGNALGRGPLVFELFQSGINHIRKQAAAGVKAYEQIELDMFRMTALYILERLKPSLMTHLLLCFAPLVRQQSLPGPPAPHMKRTATLNRLSIADYDSEPDTPRLKGSSSMSPSTAELDSQQALEEAIQGRTVAFYDQLVADMTVANLLEVPAGAPYLHLSSAVLLRGSLRVQGQALDASAPRSSSGKQQSITYHAPFVLPWIPADKDADQPPTRFVALDSSDSSVSQDDDNVLLMVRPDERSHLTDEALQAHARALDASDDGEALADLTRTPSGHRISESAAQRVRRVSQGMRALARASRSIARPLSLQAADVTEFVPPALRNAEPGQWWNTLQKRSVVPHHDITNQTEGEDAVQ